MWFTFLLIASCMFCQRFILDKKVSGDHLEFSGQALIRERSVWVLVTGSMIHAGLSHEINNMLFTFCVSYVAENVFAISKIWIFAVLIMTGAFGWITSFLYHYKLHGEIAYFIPVRGISPNMYGAAFFCMMVYPHHAMSNILWVHPLLWMMLIIAVPPYFSNRRGHSKMVWSVVAMCLGAVMYWVHTNTLWFQQMTVGTFLALYFMKCVINYVYFVAFLGSPSSSDHASHLGGAVCGFLMGLWYLHLHRTPWPFFRLDAHVWHAMKRMDFIFSVIMLCFRLIKNF